MPHLFVWLWFRPQTNQEPWPGRGRRVSPSPLWRRDANPEPAVQKDNDPGMIGSEQCENKIQSELIRTDQNWLKRTVLSIGLRKHSEVFRNSNSWTATFWWLMGFISAIISGSWWAKKPGEHVVEGLDLDIDVGRCCTKLITGTRIPRKNHRNGTLLSKNQWLTNQSESTCHSLASCAQHSCTTNRFRSAALCATLKRKKTSKGTLVSNMRIGHQIKMQSICISPPGKDCWNTAWGWKEWHRSGAWTWLTDFG